jgi:hypothetical protein
MEELILRMMAWERAKGELRSMLVTYVNDMDNYKRLEIAIEGFIKDVEDNGKQE